MTFERKMLVAFLCAAFVAAILATTGTAAPLAQLYMAPSGDDANDGYSRDTAVKTLSRVHQIIEAAQPRHDIKVNIAPGIYTKQSVVWTYTMPDHSITLRPQPGTSGRVLFDACASPGDCAVSWFTLKQADGQWSNLVFRDLAVRDYPGHAISFNGSRENVAQTFNGRNRITGMRFVDIGEVSTAIVRFVNSDENLVADSWFIRGAGTILLHAIYIAHDSDSSVIQSNVFRRISGDPIRIRDHSDNTLVENNRFQASGHSGAISLWFCDKTRRDDCTKVTDECPNMETIVFDNRWDGRDYNSTPGLPLTADRAARPGPPDCRPAPTPRFIEGDNRLR